MSITQAFSQLKNKIFNGKNPKFVYYIKAYAALATPRCLLRPRVKYLDRILDKRPDREYILDRVNYYCRAESYSGTSRDKWSQESCPLCRQPMTRQKVYYLDSMPLARHFPANLRWRLLHGDIDYVPDVPSIVKSRPIEGMPGADDVRNSILLKLDKVRHFIFVKDNIPFRDKADRAIFRGKIGNKQPRIDFMRMYYGNARVDAGAIDNVEPEWVTPKMPIHAHLKYRYIMAIEGNDVASNLKWVMSSNSIAVMPRPTCETWFMEGRLRPGYHYIEVKPDFSDLIAQLDHYSAHPDEAEAIIRHAHEYVDQFRDKRREKLISLLVLRKYLNGVEKISDEPNTPPS